MSENCIFFQNSSGVYRCEKCGFETPVKNAIRKCREKKEHNFLCVDETLPGNKLSRMIKTLLGQGMHFGCGCESYMQQMNAWGVEGCRAHIDEITDRLFKIATKKDWLIAEELDSDVTPELVGEPVPQTLRTKIARFSAHLAAQTEVGAASVRAFCRVLANRAINAAESAQKKAVL